MHDIYKLLIAAVPVLGGLITAAAKLRKRKDTNDRIGARYVSGALRLYVGRVIRRQIAAEFALRHYARIHLAGTAKTMTVPAAYPVKLKVDEVFVPLLLRGPSRGEMRHDQLVDEAGARIVVVGEPGSGKSSLFKRVFRDACRRARAHPRGVPLPILYELRHLQLPEDAEAFDHLDLLALCAKEIASMDSYGKLPTLTDLAPGAGYLILLDGLDEVRSRDVEHVTRAIVDLGKHLAAVSPQSSLIISTRTQHFTTIGRSFREAFDVVDVRPFTTSDIYEFLAKWPFDPHKRAEEIGRLFDRIRHLPSLLEMCTNPLALAMFVARDQQTGGAIAPDTRSQFYEALVEELLVNRRLRSEDRGVGSRRLKDFRETVLGKACLAHLLELDEGSNSLPYSRMLGAIKPELSDRESAEDALTQMSIETGLFSIERQGESVRFLHLTLCEYLAAREVVNRGDDAWKLIEGRLLRDELVADPSVRWEARLGEVVTFTSGIAPRVLKERVLRALAGRRYDELLLRAAIESQAYDNPIVAVAIRESANDIGAQAPANWDVAWQSQLRWLLAALRDAHVSGRRDAVPGRELPEPAEYLATLINKHGAEETLVLSLARDDPAAAISIASERINARLVELVAGAASDPAVLATILHRVDEGEGVWARGLLRAALRRSGVAAALYRWREEPSAPPAPQEWQGSKPLAGSVYARLLDTVLPYRSQWAPRDHEWFQKVARVETPRPDGQAILTLAARRGLVLAGAALPLAGGVLLLTEASLWTVLAAIGCVATGPGIALLRPVVARRRRDDRGENGIPQPQDLSQVPRHDVILEILNLAPSGLRTEGAHPHVRRFWNGIKRRDILALATLRSLRRYSPVEVNDDGQPEEQRDELAPRAPTPS